MLPKVALKGGQLLAKCALLCCLSLFIYLPSQAQDWSFAVGPGISSYIGDVTQQKLGKPGFTLNAEAWYYLNDNFQLKSGLSFYNISGSDADTTRMRSFRASNIEVYTSAMYYFKRGYFTPFAYLGIGFTTNNPMGESRIGDWDLKDTQPEGENVPGLVGIVPFGMGLEYEITPVLSVVADLSLRYALNDRLDAVSRDVIQVDQLSAEAIEYHESLSDYVARQVNEQPTLRGGISSDNDMYGMFTLKVKFTPTASIFGCIDPYKYSRPDRRRKHKNYEPL